MRASSACGCARPTARISRGPSELRPAGAANCCRGGRRQRTSQLTLGYVGMIHSNFPVNAVYQWSRGPEEAILYVDLNDDLGIQR